MIDGFVRKVDAAIGAFHSSRAGDRSGAPFDGRSGRVVIVAAKDIRLRPIQAPKISSGDSQI
jgi:hypothetical protein